MTFIEPDGTRREVDAPLGLSIMEVAHRHDIDIEGACGGSLSCSTCHVIAFGLTRTSRLCCQLIISEELDGITVTLPEETHNFLLD
jgi:2Fe-2S ferredoxin